MRQACPVEAAPSLASLGGALACGRRCRVPSFYCDRRGVRARPAGIASHGVAHASDGRTHDHISQPEALSAPRLRGRMHDNIVPRGTWASAAGLRCLRSSRSMKRKDPGSVALAWPAPAAGRETPATGAGSRSHLRHKRSDHRSIPFSDFLTSWLMRLRPSSSTLERSCDVWGGRDGPRPHGPRRSAAHARLPFYSA